LRSARGLQRMLRPRWTGDVAPNSSNAVDTRD
jgi:hypothetical protein